MIELLMVLHEFFMVFHGITSATLRVKEIKQSFCSLLLLHFVLLRKELHSWGVLRSLYTMITILIVGDITVQQEDQQNCYFTMSGPTLIVNNNQRIFCTV